MCKPELPVDILCFFLKLVSGAREVLKSGLYSTHQPRMPLETSNFALGCRIIYSDRIIATTAYDTLPVILHTSNSFLMASACCGALASVDVPYLDKAIARGRNELVFVNMNGIDSR